MAAPNVAVASGSLNRSSSEVVPRRRRRGDAEPALPHRRRRDRPASGASWGEVRRVLENAQLCWITTVRTDGRPHATPLVAVWLDAYRHRF